MMGVPLYCSMSLTIIAGTNRKNSNSASFIPLIRESVTAFYGGEIKTLSLTILNSIEIKADIFEEVDMSSDLEKVRRHYFVNTDAFIFIIPEYNGSFPGILKWFIDAISVIRYKDLFSNKHALLIGISTGKAGNLRGLEHFSSILQFLGCHIYPEKKPVSLVHTLIAEDASDHLILQQELADLTRKFIKYINEGDG